MRSLGIDGWQVGWNPARPASDGKLADLGDAPDLVQVGPWPDLTGWSVYFDCTDGCCEVPDTPLTAEGKVIRMFAIFHTLVVGDGVDPQAAHLEFLKIDEYRRRISPDIKGADPVRGSPTTEG